MYHRKFKLNEIKRGSVAGTQGTRGSVMQDEVGEHWPGPDQS